MRPNSRTRSISLSSEETNLREGLRNAKIFCKEKNNLLERFSNPNGGGSRRLAPPPGNRFRKDTTFRFRAIR
jgi:hypothetical protein